MAKEPKLSKVRLRSSYFTSVISIAMVLFLIGLMGFLVLNGKKLSDYIRENIGFSVIIHEHVKDVDILKLQKDLDASTFVKSTMFISKEKAARDFQEELGEDFINFLGYNPLLPTIEIKLNAPYANTDSLTKIENVLKKNSLIKEVYYQKDLVHSLNENIRKISIILGLFSALMLTISVALINNTIRLTIYSKRFLINTMQLVGATRGFIQKPFILKGLLHGIYGSILAIIMLSASLYAGMRQVPEFVLLAQADIIFILFGGMIICGILFSTIFTFVSVNKFLRISNDRLYI